MKQLGDYPIEAKIGEGAMGTVYRAWHPRLNIHVALKTIQDSRLEGQDLLDRFKLEGQALVKLRHQNIVQIYDAAEANGIHFIVMEYVNGPGLDQLISNRVDLALAKKIAYILPICQALDHAHKRRLFHRDIKPANIMLQHDGNEEVVKVVDFGIARLLDFSQTTTNLFIGAPAYMAPELISASDRANEKTDIWALGVTMYELIAYQRPFEGSTLEELKRKIVHGSPRSLHDLASGCPDDLVSLVERMLCRTPEERYQVIEDVLIDLEPIAKRLKCETAAVLVRRANEYFEVGDFEAAKLTLNEARQYDPANTQIKALMLKIQDELHRMELIPRLQGHLKRGKELVQSGAFREARVEAEAALGLDSRFEPAHKLMAEIEQAIARVQIVEQKIQLGKQRLSEGSLTQAEELLIEVEGMDVIHPQLRELKRQIDDERQRRDRRRRLNLLLNQARGLLAGLDYQECLAVLLDGLKEFPGEPELRKLQEAARAELAELEKQRAKQREIGECRTLVAQEDFDTALIRLRQLGKLYPADSVIKDLSTMAEEGAQQLTRRRRLEAGMAELRDLLAAGEYKEVVSRGEELLREFPKDRGILDVVNYAVAEIVQEELKQKQAAKEIHIRELLNAGDYASAESEASRAADEYPANLSFAAMLADALRLKRKKEEQRELEREVERRRAERQRRESEEHRITDIRALTANGELTAATKLLDETVAQGMFSARDERAKLLRAEIEEKRRLNELKAQQDRQRQEREARCIASIRDLMKEGDLRGATQLLIQSVQEKALLASSEQVKELQAEIEERRRQEEQQKLEQARRREEQERRIESAVALIEREEWEEAAKLLKDISQERITSALAARIEQLQFELQEKKYNKEFFRRAEQRRREDRDRRLEEIAAFLQRNDETGASEILGHALADGLLDPADGRVKNLQSEIDDRRRQAEARRKEQQHQAELEARHALDLQEKSVKMAGRGEIEEHMQEAERLNLQKQDQVLKEAHENLNAGDYGATLILINKSLDDGVLARDDRRVSALIDKAAEKKAEEKERKNRLLQRKREGLDRARRLLASNSFEECLSLLEDLQRDFPGDAELSGLSRAAESSKKKRQQLDCIRSLVDRRELGEARKQLGLLLKDYPQDAETRNLQESLQREEAQERRNVQAAQHFARVRDALQANKLDEAIRLGVIALRSFPEETRIQELVERAKLLKKEQVKKAEKPERAETAKVGRGGGGGSSATLIGATPPEAQSTPPAAPPHVEAAPAAPAHHGEALRAVERLLATFMGPLAILIVKKARVSSDDANGQLEMLASSLRAEGDRQRFLQHRDEVLSWLRVLPSIKGRALSDTTIFPPKNAGKIDPDSVATAGAQLTKYLGPIAKVLAVRTAREADSLANLYRMLAEHVTNKEDRARFLRESGFSD